MSLIIDNRVFFPAVSGYRERQRYELLLLVADRFLPNEGNLRKVCKKIAGLRFDRLRAIRLEHLSICPESLRLVSDMSLKWYCLARRREEEESFPFKSSISASATVSINMFWRARQVKRSLKAFESIILCRDVAFDVPQVIAMIRVIDLHSRAKRRSPRMFYDDSGIEGQTRYFYLKFLGANPDNLLSANRVQGCTTALVGYLLQRCSSEGVKGIYLEAVKAAEVVFEKLGFVKLDKRKMICSNVKNQPMLLLFRNDVRVVNAEIH